MILTFSREGAGGAVDVVEGGLGDESQVIENTTPLSAGADQLRIPGEFFRERAFQPTQPPTAKKQRETTLAQRFH